MALVAFSLLALVRAPTTAASNAARAASRPTHPLLHFSPLQPFYIVLQRLLLVVLSSFASNGSPTLTSPLRRG